MCRVYGAADPNSGTATLIEVAKGLGRLYSEHNWRPLRSIYLLSWSGEEYGLLGSTGWAELNEPLIKRAVAYLNSDTTVSGDHLSVASSPSLISLWKQVMDDLNNRTGIINNNTNEENDRRNVRNNKRRHTTTAIKFANPPYGDVLDANTGWEVPMDATNNDNGESPINILGSGSDYTAFLDHFGIPSMDFRFGKPQTMYGQYHSIYDSFQWMDTFGGRDGQPGSAFELMEFSAKIWGLLTIRLASSEIVPLDHILQGQAMTKYTSHIEEQVKSKGVVDLKNLTKAVESYKQAAAKLHLECSSVKMTTK